MRPAGVICEIMKDDGTMARMPDLELFAEEHDLRILTIAELIQYRLENETLVERLVERPLRLDQTGSEWLGIVYQALVEPRQALALVKGNVRGDEPVLCRVHSGSIIGDLFCSPPAEGGSNLREAIARIESHGSGVLLYLGSLGTLSDDIERFGAASVPGQVPPPKDSVPEAPGRGAERHTLRKFGLGAQMLADLGVRKLRLLTNSQRKIAGLTGYGLEIVERIPLMGNGGREHDDE
jgi:3,4-dihydroxy 2-butanone 4-phosphate synthase/GTP cyclohydrolase II